EMLENQDARGSPNADAASDEEDVDWDVDPLTISDQTVSANGNKAIRNGNNSGGDHHTDESTDDDGPTFEDAGLDSASDFDEDSPADIEPEADALQDNTNAIKYSDFFDPPAIN